jgi:hypothetical protein
MTENGRMGSGWNEAGGDSTVPHSSGWGTAQCHTAALRTAQAPGSKAPSPPGYQHRGVWAEMYGGRLNELYDQPLCRVFGYAGTQGSRLIRMRASAHIPSSRLPWM